VQNEGEDYSNPEVVARLRAAVTRRGDEMFGKDRTATLARPSQGMKLNNALHAGPMRGKRTVDPELRERALRMLREGKAAKDIAVDLGVKESWVRARREGR